MKIEDLLAEVYDRKQKELREAISKEKEKRAKAIRETAAFKQASAMLGKLLEQCRRNGFHIKDLPS